MAKKLPILRVAGPALMVSLILFAACTVSAVFLYRLHADTAESLAEDIDSRRVAGQIETTLRNLITLIKNGSDQVDALHEKIQELLSEARDLANTEQEVALESLLERSFEHYRNTWDMRGDGPEADQNRVQQALKILQAEAAPHAARLRQYNTHQMEKSEAALRRTVKWMAWAMVAVGSIGSLGGILFGYSVARALRQSIYKLSVRIRDAADKLREELPTVTISRGDGIDYLHDQMKTLVHDIEQVVDRLQERKQEVLRAEQMAAVGQLAAGVAHELRNPLTAVKLLVQNSREDLARRGLPAEDLDLIEQEIRRLERSLQSFLDFARPPKMERRKVELVSIVQGALALFGGRARQQNVVVDLKQPEVSVVVEADGEQLRQLFVNLAMNALDAMPRQGTLSAEITRPRPDWVEVRIRDTGPGIDTDLLPRLFQPFVSGKETGLGLGLVVCRRIAQAHGGALRAEATPGQGACFVLTLPVAPVDPAAESAQPSRTADHVHLAGHR